MLPRVSASAVWLRIVVLVAVALLAPSPAHGADRASAARGGRRVGIDTRFGDLVREAGEQYYKKQYAQAVSLYTEALAMRPDPKNAALVYAGRAWANSDAENHRAAIADFDALIRLRPADSTAHNMAAWLRATSRDPGARDGRLAVKHATRACELTKWKDSDLLDTLAAAHAEAGEFDRAVQYQKQAISLAPWSDRMKMNERLRMFEGRTPYRLKEKKR